MSRRADARMSEPPADPASPRRHRLRRVLLWVSLGLAVVIVAAVGTGVGLYVHLNGQITRVHGVISSPGPQGSGLKRGDGTTAPPPAPAANYLLVGTDSRAGAQNLPHTGGAACQCADTIIVAHVPKGHQKAILVSIPRDSWVTLPDYTTPDGKHIPAHEAKINSALAVGGPGLLVATVQSLTGLHIDHYLAMNFAGFVDMVDAVGGINVCLSEPTQDWHTGIDLSAGLHHLDGVQALGYVRQRHGLPNGDIDRIKRQQVVIGEIVDKVLAAGMLLHPVQLTHLLDVVTKSVTVDDTLSLSDMRKLAGTFSHLDGAHVRFATVPITTEGGYRDGQSVVLLDQPALDAMFNDVSKGHLPGSGHHSGSTSPTPAPSKSDGVSCLR